MKRKLNKDWFQYVHGGTGTPEFTAWSKAKERCYSKNSQRYHRYGARGIIVCDRWLNSFPNFLEDMGKRPSKKHSLDRIDNNGNYCKENCRWATSKQQGKNRSTTILYKGKSAIEASKKLGGNPSLIPCRLRMGWSIEKSFTTPVISKFRKKS